MSCWLPNRWQPFLNWASPAGDIDWISARKGRGHTGPREPIYFIRPQFNLLGSTKASFMDCYEYRTSVADRLPEPSVCSADWRREDWETPTEHANLLTCRKGPTFRELMRFIVFNAIWLFPLPIQDVAVVSAGLNHLFGTLYQAKTEKYTFALVPVCVAYLDLVLCLQMKGPFVKQSRTFYQVNVFIYLFILNMATLG